MPNPLLNDRDVEFLLYEVLRAEELCALPWFAEHGRETFDLALRSARAFAREVLWPTYRPMDAEGPRLEGGRVRVHPLMRELYPRMVELGLLGASRPAGLGGQQLPLLVSALAGAYLMAANGSAYGFLGLTAGAAHLLEAFGDPSLQAIYMRRMLDGRWTGTMALTEPQAGSSLADVQTRARPGPEGAWLLEGSKVFISGGDNDFAENVVHLVLGRIAGAPAGTRGISLFCVPRLRPAPGADADAAALPLVDNDCASAGVFHKMGWRGIPSIALNLGERGDCRGWLVGEAGRGLQYMFQMMNEARLMVGLNGCATAAVAYQEALEYARTRPQGRPLAARDPATPQVPILQHADVRRMLLRQKAIAEGGLALAARCARWADEAAHHVDAEARARAQALLDLLTPVAKSFPAERGFEANVLAVQVHGGYGYTAEYLPEAWLRDQKLNSIHEGTSGIQGLDLLGRKVVAGGGAALQALAGEIAATCARAVAAGPAEGAQAEALGAALGLVAGLTQRLGGLGLAGDRDGMLRHAAAYLELFSTVVIAWQWLEMAVAARHGLAERPASAPFYRGKLAACAHWFATDLPRVEALAALCESGERSFEDVRDDEW